VGATEAVAGTAAAAAAHPVAATRGLMAAIKEQVVGPPSRPGEAAAAAAAAAPAGEGEVFGEGGMGGYAASDGGAAGAARGKGMGRRSDEEDVFADAASEVGAAE
jgi:hypothetical protein